MCRIYIILLLTLFLINQASASPESESKSLVSAVEQGKAVYSRFCSVCHGVDGKSADSQLVDLQTQPPDLTQIKKSNNNQFPWLRLYSVINSQESVGAHESREMPEWNQVFDMRNWGSDDNDEFAEEIIYGRIFVLLMYLNSIQEASVSD